MMNKRKLRKQLAEATSYDQWKSIALELDYLENNVEWKEQFVSEHYHFDLIYDRLNTLRTLLRDRNDLALVRALREGLYHDLGNIGDPVLYSHCYIGTKHLIEEYISSVCEALNYLCDHPVEGLPESEKIDFFKDTLLGFGRPALLLSGGATLGLFHIGVVKALWEKGLLPKVIAGSSAGSIMAAMLGNYTDAELPAIFDPRFHYLKPWKWKGIFSGLAGNGFMDAEQLQNCLRSNIGELTFEESFKKTGRSINITVSPTLHHQKARLLSRYTSPYLLMWSAAQASCSVPGLFPPAMLWKKNAHGEKEPYMESLKWVDGSVVSDLPINRLRHLYDVNFSIVSQTNPHIVPIIQFNQQKKGKTSLLKLPVKALATETRFHGQLLFNALRKQTKSEILRQTAGQMYTIMAQNYEGDVTIAPKVSLSNFAKVLSNPSDDFVRKLILEGERATWPKIAHIRTHAKISQTLENCIKRLENQLRQKRGHLRLIG